VGRSASKSYGNGGEFAQYVESFHLEGAMHDETFGQAQGCNHVFKVGGSNSLV